MYIIYYYFLLANKSDISEGITPTQLRQRAKIARERKQLNRFMELTKEKETKQEIVTGLPMAGLDASVKGYRDPFIESMDEDEQYELHLYHDEDGYELVFNEE